jgi:hypothetical protein
MHRPSRVRLHMDQSMSLSQHSTASGQGDLHPPSYIPSEGQTFGFKTTPWLSLPQAASSTSSLMDAVVGVAPPSDVSPTLADRSTMRPPPSSFATRYTNPTIVPSSSSGCVSITSSEQVSNTPSQDTHDSQSSWDVLSDAEFKLNKPPVESGERREQVAQLEQKVKKR